MGKIYCADCKFFDNSLDYEAMDRRSKPDGCESMGNAEKVHVENNYKKEGYYKYIRAFASEANKNNDCIYYDKKMEKKRRWWNFDSRR